MFELRATNGSNSQVEFYNGTTKLTSQTQPGSDGNYRYNWSNVAAGNYNLTAKATDNLGTSTTSTTQSVKVASGQAQLYDIHSDQLGTPRLITDASGQEVWRWDSAPFGETAPNENPNGKGKFEFNLRFPGQYYDKETGLHYNYFRDYDPQTGRYVQSDPIGLRGGINTFGYVGGDPMSQTDQFGLANGPAVNVILGAYVYRKRPLTQCEKDVLGPYFPGVNLPDIQLHSGPGILPFGKSDGTTFGNNIYVTKQIYEGGNISDLGLIAHEIRHSMQYDAVGYFNFFGMYAAESALHGYENAYPEREAYSFQFKVMADLKRRYPNGTPCECKK